MRRSKYTFKVVFAFFFTTFITGFLWAGAPGDIVMETIDRGMAVLRDPSLSSEDKFSERRDKLWAEISHLFDFEEMSKRSLGKHWGERTSEEKEEFIRLFTRILRDTYVGKTDAYAGESIEYLRERQSGNRSKVQTNFITNKGQEISVDFSLIKKDEKWEIYDMIIEGISLVNNYRSQFREILRKSTYEELVLRIMVKKGIDQG